MTTQSWSTRIRHDSDAMFREWGSELSAKFAAAGLVQTSDTGQIDWGTVTRAGTNSNAGYEIWRFDDTQQSSAPIFMRMDYGTGANASGPRLQITVGTGSNGSGTITGTALTSARSVIGANSAQTSDTSRNSYVCVTEGFFGLNWKVGAGTGVEGWFFLNRTNTAGTPDATGAFVLWITGLASSMTAQALRFSATAAAYTARTSASTAQICLWPQSPSSSLVGSDFQAALAFTITPRVQPLDGICGILSSELVPFNTFTATLIGTTPRTYLALNTPFAVMDPSGSLNPAMLWE